MSLFWPPLLRTYAGSHRWLRDRHPLRLCALRSVKLRRERRGRGPKAATLNERHNVPIRRSRLLQHGVIPGSSQTKARESALQERMRPASCGLATMESGNGILCRTGRIVEADIDSAWWIG